MGTSRKNLGRIAVVLATAAWIVPTAQARVANVPGESVTPSASVVRPDDRAARVAPQSQLSTIVRPDDRAVRNSPVSEPGLVLRRNPDLAVKGPPLGHIVATHGDGFSWTYPAVLAGLALAFALLVGGAVVATRRHLGKAQTAGA
jgi:hypothetical protein